MNEPNLLVVWLIVFLVAVVMALIVGALIVRRFLIEPLQRSKARVRVLEEQLNERVLEVVHNKDELNTILSSMVEGVIVVAANEKILYVSPNVSDMLEMRSKDVAFKPYWEVIRNREINACLKQALNDQQAVNKEIVLLGTHDLFFGMQISPVVQSGKLTSVVAVFHDITELKRLVRLRSEFVANVSHELKTPLTSIKGFVETLREGGMDNKVTARRFLDIIQKQTGHLEELVDDLLSLSAIESKEDKMNITAQSIVPIVQSALLMHKNKILSTHLQVESHFPSDLPNVSVDARRMEQVFINLIDNAIKFTPPDGRIDITGRLDGAMIRVDVKDTGVGIATEHLSRIFERFYRVDKARTRLSGGTGLGLSIVKHIIVAHQGRIEVASVFSQGSTFSVYLPAVH